METLQNIIRQEEKGSTETPDKEGITDLFELPEELLEVILCQLSVNDLVACSKVSKFWRNGVNLDSVWRQLCRRDGFGDKLVESTPSHLFVDPSKFDSESTEDNSLEPLCHWREVYGWFRRLTKNWQNKKFQKYRLAETMSPVYCLDCDGTTATTGHEDSTIAVWSVKSVPHHVQRIRAVLSDYPVISIKTTTRYIVAVQKKLIQVYHNSGSYLLTDIKSFELGEDNVEQMDRLRGLGDEYGSWYKESLRISEEGPSLIFRPLVYAINGDHLFASCCGSGMVRVWTLPGSEVVSGKAGLSEIQQIESDEHDVYFVIHTEVTYLLKYSKEEDAVKMLLTVPGLKKFVIGQELVMALPSPGDVCLKRIWVWKKGDYSQPVGTKTISSSHFCAVLAQSTYVIYSEDSIIQVWNPLKKLTVSSFSVGSTVGFIRAGFACTVVVFMNASLHLWDWYSGKRLYRFYTGLEWTGDYRHLVWLNCSMLLSAGVNHQLEMLSFL